MELFKSADEILNFLQLDSKNKIEVTIYDRQTLELLNINDDKIIIRTWDIFNKDIEKGFYPKLSIKRFKNNRYFIAIFFNSNNQKTELGYNKSEDVIRSLLNELIENKIL